MFPNGSTTDAVTNPGLHWKQARKQDQGPYRVALTCSSSRRGPFLPYSGRLPATGGTALLVPDPVRLPVAPRVVSFFTEGKASTIAISRAPEAERGSPLARWCLVPRRGW